LDIQIHFRVACSIYECIEDMPTRKITLRKLTNQCASLLDNTRRFNACPPKQPANKKMEPEARDPTAAEYRALQTYRFFRDTPYNML
jgi:hypothetical protein